MDLHRNRAYYRKSTGQIATMVSRGGGLCVMSDGGGSQWTVTDEELDRDYCTVPGLPDAPSSEAGDGVLVSLESAGGASRYEVKARRGLVPGVPILDASSSGVHPVAGAGKLGVCSWCGDESGRCEHVLGEKAGMRVESVVKREGDQWDCVMGDGVIVRVLRDGAGDLLVSPYRKRVDEQVRVRVLAAVRECIAGGGSWMDGGDDEVEGAPGDGVKGELGVVSGNEVDKGWPGHEWAAMGEVPGDPCPHCDGVGEEPEGGAGDPCVECGGAGVVGLGSLLESAMEGRDPVTGDPLCPKGCGVAGRPVPEGWKCPACGHRWGGGSLVAFPDEPWRRRPDGGWEPGFQGDRCMCGQRAKLVKVEGGRAWYECACGVGFTGPERGIPSDVAVDFVRFVRSDAADAMAFAAKVARAADNDVSVCPFMCRVKEPGGLLSEYGELVPRGAGVPEGREAWLHFTKRAVGVELTGGVLECQQCGAQWVVKEGEVVIVKEPADDMSSDYEELTMDEKQPVAVVGRLLDSHRVVGVSVESDGEGWLVEFLDGSCGLVYYEDEPERDGRSLHAKGYGADAGEWKGTQARQAIKAVRAYLEGEPFVQPVSVRGGVREWLVHFPNGLGVRVSDPGEGWLFASQDDIEQWVDGMEGDVLDSFVVKWRDRAVEAVKGWLVKHDGVKLRVDNEWGEFERTDPRTAADMIGSLVRKVRERDLSDWSMFELPVEHGTAYSKPGVTVSDNGVALSGERDAGECEWIIRRKGAGYALYLAPDLVVAKGGRTITVARNADKLASFVLPKVEGAKPQVSKVWAGGGGMVGRKCFQDWHVRFHDGTQVWVREERQGWEDSELCCPIGGGPGVGSGEPGNDDVNLDNYGEAAIACVKAQIEWQKGNVKFNKRGLGFAVELSFGDSGRVYEWAWTTPTIPPEDGDEEDWQCLTEFDPHDKSGWRDESLRLLKQHLRAQYVVEDADREPGGPDNDVIVWTDGGPARCHVHPDKDADGRGYVIVDVPEKHEEVRDRVEEAVKAHLNKPCDAVKQAELEGRLKEVSAELGARAKELYDQQCEADEERGRQIEAAERREGFYPVERAPGGDRPRDDPERFNCWRVATEAGMVFVRVQWADFDGEKRVVAYDFLEDLENKPTKHMYSKDLRKHVVESIQAHIKNAHLEVLQGSDAFPHDSGVLSECKCQRRHPQVAPALEKPGPEEEQRCPHDGGTCHHDCEPGECYREKGGMSLTTPHEGYPEMPKGWVVFDLLGANVGVPDDHNVYLDHIRLSPGRKHDYVFHKRGDRDWLLAVDPTVVQSRGKSNKHEAQLRVCHLGDAPSEREVWSYKWQFNGVNAEDTVRHTEHCYKRMIHGDGECECGGRVGITPVGPGQTELGPVEYINLPHEDIGATVCTSFIMKEPCKTKPTLEGLEERLNLLEAAINELMDRELAQIRKAISQQDSKAFGRMESVAQMDGRVTQAQKGIASHEQWLQGLERRFAEAAVSGSDKSSRALLKTVLDKQNELESRTAAQKDLGSALSKKVGEISHLMDETRNANLRVERLVTDLGLPVAKLIEIVVGRNVQVANIAEDEDNIDLLGQFFALYNQVQELVDDDDEDDCNSCEHYEDGECQHCEDCGCVPCECTCEEDAALARKAQEVLEDEDDPVVPFDPADFDYLHEDPATVRQILDQRCPPGTRVKFQDETSVGVVVGRRRGPASGGQEERLVRWHTPAGQNEVWHHVDCLLEIEAVDFPEGTRVGFTGNTTMKGVVKGIRKRGGKYQFMVSWKGEDKTGGGWYDSEDLYELEEEAVYPGAEVKAVAADQRNANGDIFPGAAFEVPVSGSYAVPWKTDHIHMDKGTYPLVSGSGVEPKAKVPVGVGVIVTKDIGKDGLFVLLGKRKGAHGEGQWSFPGGRIEPDEDPKACAARELDEETGIAVHPSRLVVWDICPFNNTITGGEPWTTLFYHVLVSEEEGKPELREPGKCSEWDYFNVKNLPEPLFEAAAECARQTGWIIPSEVDHCSD